MPGRGRHPCVCVCVCRQRSAGTCPISAGIVKTIRTRHRGRWTLPESHPCRYRERKFMNTSSPLRKIAFMIITLLLFSTQSSRKCNQTAPLHTLYPPRRLKRISETLAESVVSQRNGVWWVSREEATRNALRLIKSGASLSVWSGPDADRPDRVHCKPRPGEAARSASIAPAGPGNIADGPGRVRPAPGFRRSTTLASVRRSPRPTGLWTVRCQRGVGPYPETPGR